MERTLLKDIKQKTGQEIRVNGFVQTIRDQGMIKFIILRDVSATAQTVVLKSHSKAFETVKNLTHESVVQILGKVKEQTQAPDGYEIEAHTINVISHAASELPIPVVQKGGEETEQPIRFDWRFLDLRRPEKQLIFRAWTELEKGFREYFDMQNYIQIYTPSFMNTPSESGAEVFEVSYFDRKAYLAQSPQFYKQMAMAAGFEKVFITEPSYRAEPSYTTRHMTEFTGWDFEISYIESHYEVMSEMENLIVSGFEHVNKSLGLNIEVPKIPFPKLTMEEVKRKLSEAGIPSDKAGDINAEEERELYKVIKEQTGHDFVFVVDWPKDTRPFYHMRHTEKPDVTKSFDLVYKGLEIVTGAQREHRYNVLIEQAQEKGMSVASLENYLNFFKYGCPPHGGVGIGPGRIVMKMMDLQSVKEATFLPRDVKRITP